jgi:hypothetical protein
LEEWADQGADHPGEPWRSFERARMHFRTGEPDQAVHVWQEIVLTEGISSRHTLQAWHFMRQAGRLPSAEVAEVVLGAVAEVPMRGSHDLLAAYRDRTAKYVNYSRRATTWEGGPEEQMEAAVGHWLAVAQIMASSIGPWNKMVLPPLPTGHARVAALTPNGPYFGQGPATLLSADSKADSFLGAATRVVQLMVDSTTR